MPQASRLEEELLQHFSQAAITLHPSSGGDFRVIIDDQVLFDKSETNRFPKEQEILQIIKQL